MNIKGIAASDGISIAKVYKLESIALNVTNDLISNPKLELQNLTDAMEISSAE